MNKKMENTDLYLQFLKLLNVGRETPSIKALSDLLQSYFSKMPFENISKLYYKEKYNLQDIPSFSQYLHGISEYNFGGTCYSNNYYLYKLLKFLGYTVKLCGADMNEPDVHLVNIVSFDKKEYLVDVGSAAPFLKPIPLFLNKEYTLKIGHNQYILKPQDENGYSKMEMIRDEKLKFGYLVKPYSRNINFFNKAIKDSFTNESTFMNSILITKYISGSFYMLHNFNLIKSNGEEYSTYKISDLTMLYQKIEEIFHIPVLVSELALNKIGNLKEIWG